jgi:abortive infection bacteriophage resistance protein
MMPATTLGEVSGLFCLFRDDAAMPTTLCKPYRTPADLINDLGSKKLEFLDEAEAENTLSQISYYHFKIYLHPLLDPASPGGKHYRKDIFEYGVELYRFDENFVYCCLRNCAA